MNNQLETRIKSSLVNGRLTCETAHAIAHELNISPVEVGETSERLGIKITDC